MTLLLVVGIGLQIVLGRTNEEIGVLKKAFFDMYEADLSVMANDDLSGEFHQIVTTALQATQVEYKHHFHTKEKAAEDAEKIYKAGEGKWGTDEGAFVKTILASPPKHLQHIEEIYNEKYKHGLVYAIESEFSGSSATALSFHGACRLAAVYCCCGTQAHWRVQQPSGWKREDRVFCGRDLTHYLILSLYLMLRVQ